MILTVYNYFQNEFEYYNVKVEDISRTDILCHLDNTVTKMHEFAESNPQKVYLLVFGICWSATIVTLIWWNIIIITSKTH